MSSVIQETMNNTMPYVDEHDMERMNEMNKAGFAGDAVPCVRTPMPIPCFRLMQYSLSDHNAANLWWYHFLKMMEEALLLKQLDSDIVFYGHKTTIRTAFVDLNTGIDAPGRQSNECRAFLSLIYPELNAMFDTVAADYEYNTSAELPMQPKIPMIQLLFKMLQMDASDDLLYSCGRHAENEE